jgi:hypothetical protein
MKLRPWMFLLATSALLFMPLAAGAFQTPSVKIAEPAMDSAVAGPDLRVKVEAEGVELGSRGRNGAHVLLRLDNMPAMKSYAESFTFRGVADGEHKLEVELRRPDGGGFEPPVIARTTFTVVTTRDGDR